MKKVCIIPARAGSQRVKNKNSRKLGKHPLFAWQIRNAIESKVFDEVLFSSDSEKYLQTAEKSTCKQQSSTGLLRFLDLTNMPCQTFE
jgi:CMP-N-acetylneuraminic acid synthetase